MDQNQTSSATGQFEQVVERLKPASNVLVTVRTNPSVDQLAACLGLTIVLNKMGKHATAVFSGEVPSTIDFLHPEKTLEKNTDSLRDFIIALDKSKADKLRYKVEDSGVVKIFITPYKTSIDERDLNFSQGDFNIDAVVALGVHDKAQLDTAILAHGRILHDATVMSLNTSKGDGNQLGSIAWLEPNASSLSEMVGDIARELSPDIFDEQISTALLTGIVSETDRFSNQKATPHSMSIAGILMAAGASAQLVTTKLQEASKQQLPKAIPQAQSDEPSLDGLLKIQHDQQEAAKAAAEAEMKVARSRSVQSMPVPEQKAAPSPPPSPYLETPPLPPTEPNSESASQEGPDNHVVFEPPKLGGQLTANSVPEYKQYSDTTDPLSVTEDRKSTPILNHPDPRGEQTLSEIEKNVDSPHLMSHDSLAADNDKTLSEIEKNVDSPHLTIQNNGPAPTQVNDARDAVAQAAFNDDTYRPEPISALGAQPVDLDFGNSDEPEPPQASREEPTSPPPPVPPPMTPPTT